MQALLLTCLAALGSGIGTLIPSLWFLTPFGLTLFFFVLFTKIERTRSAFFLGWLFGAVTTGLSIWWFWDALPLNWIGLYSTSAQWYAVGSAWFFCAFGMGLATGGAAGLLVHVRTLPFLPLSATALWVLQEEARMWIFSLITISPESLIGPHFSSAAFGYVLAEVPYLLQLAAWGGVAMLSGVIALGASTLAYTIYLHHKHRPYKSAIVPGIVLAVVVLLPTLFPFAPTATETTLSVAVVALDTPHGFVHSLSGPLANAAAAGADIVFLPEGAGVHSLWPNEQERKTELARIFGGRDALIVSSNYRPHRVGDGKAELTYDDAKGEVLQTYQKMFLMPLGEYTPIVFTYWLTLIGDARLTEYTHALAASIDRGTKLTPLTYRNVTIGALLCSDMLSPQLFHRLGTQGATVLATLADTSWFHHSPLLFEKTLQIAQVHAVQNRAYFVYAANGMPSFVLNPEGTVMVRSAWRTPDILYTKLPTN